jgi:hypothetical protein
LKYSPYFSYVRNLDIRSNLDENKEQSRY